MKNFFLEELITRLESSGILRSELIKDVLRKVDRKDFVVEAQKDFAYEDCALSIANDQTISQPTTVVFMLELLETEKGDTVLDVGAGSGWVSCLLGHMVGRTGYVYGYEINETVGQFGKENVQRSGVKNVGYVVGDASKDWHKHAPYDRIHVAAAFVSIPKDLLMQLKVGGKLVAPTQDGNIRVVTRKEENNFEEDSHYGFAFVPFVEE